MTKPSMSRMNSPGSIIFETMSRSFSRSTLTCDPSISPNPLLSRFGRMILPFSSTTDRDRGNSPTSRPTPNTVTAHLKPFCQSDPEVHGVDARNALVILTGMQDSGVGAHAPRVNRSPENTSGGEVDTSFSGPAIRFGLSAKATILVSSNEQFPLATPMPPSRKIARRACLEYPGAGILAAGAAGAAWYLNGGLLRAQITKTSCGGFLSLLQSHSVRPLRLDFVGSTRELSPGRAY